MIPELKVFVLRWAIHFPAEAQDTRQQRQTIPSAPVQISDIQNVDGKKGGCFIALSFGVIC